MHDEYDHPDGLDRYEELCEAERRNRPVATAVIVGLAISAPVLMLFYFALGRLV